MWSQEWEDIIDIVIPYPNKPSIDVTKEMIKQGYKPWRMFHTADDFFRSLGLPAMNAAFWNSQKHDFNCDNVSITQTQ